MKVVKNETAKKDTDYGVESPFDVFDQGKAAQRKYTEHKCYIRIGVDDCS